MHFALPLKKEEALVTSQVLPKAFSTLEWNEELKCWVLHCFSRRQRVPQHQGFQASYSCPGSRSYWCHFHLLGTSSNQITFIQKLRAEKYLDS